jgi:hypothetical protein
MVGIALTSREGRLGGGCWSWIVVAMAPSLGRELAYFSKVSKWASQPRR